MVPDTKLLKHGDQLYVLVTVVGKPDPKSATVGVVGATGHTATIAKSDIRTVIPCLAVEVGCTVRTTIMPLSKMEGRVEAISNGKAWVKFAALPPGSDDRIIPIHQLKRVSL